VQEDKPRGVLHGEPLEDDAAYQAEDRRVRADAEGERERDHGRQTGVLPHMAKREPHILDEGFHGVPPNRDSGTAGRVRATRMREPREVPPGLAR
jgi:hypothetical protein